MDQDKQATILIVDDEPLNLNVLVGLLSNDYKTFVAKSGAQALGRIEKGPLPDLILLDVMMPEMNGLEVCRLLKSNPLTSPIPVIFVTAMGEEADESEGFKVGAVDYINKPISPAITKARIATHLNLAKARQALQEQNLALEYAVRQRTLEIQLTQDITTLAMASLAETRDNETGNHIRRTQNYVKLLAETLRHHDDFKEALDSDRVIDLLYKSAPLHDIGKVGIADNILLKPGKLDDDEFVVMKTHAQLGGLAIEKAEGELGEAIHDVLGGQSFLHFAREIANYHHEKWDGSGYPEGLKGDDIPLSARLMAVADVYDALISKRVYKPAFPHEKAVSIIKDGSGSHFDPRIVEAFLAVEDDVKAIAARYSDEHTEAA